MLIIGADHGGFELKESMKEYFTKAGVKFFDLGSKDNDSSDDFPDIALPLAKMVAEGQYERGLLICGSGAGVCMAANRIKGIRAVNCFNEEIAKLSRQHNDSNVLCLGGRFLSKEEAINIFKVWEETEFLDGKYYRRNEKIDFI